jgi:transcriptional regulator with GAF, ATPase, and Fis domain
MPQSLPLDAGADRPASDDLGSVDLLDQLAFEALLFELSATVIDLAPGGIEQRITRALEAAARFLDADRSTFLELRDDATRLFCVAEWCAHGMPRIPVGDITEEFRWIIGQLSSGRIVRLPDLPRSLPEEVSQEERRLVHETGVRASLMVPVRVGGRSFGALTFGYFRHASAWPDRVVRRVQLLGEIFANAFARERAFAEIRRLHERLEAENVVLREELAGLQGFEDLVGRSARWQRVLEQIQQVAGTDASVLLLGETGTGKDVVAHAIHTRSRRKDRPFVRVNCAALPSSLIESEFFGHEKGAFTGALARRLGRFELADGGTIFLDEIGDLAPELQVKLLRVLQQGEFERLGSTRTIRVDARVIAATNRDLAQGIVEGRFRSDLFYRLNVFPITLPALRERVDDVPLLTWYFVNRRQAKFGKQIRSIAETAMDALRRHPWPGNVRELENVVERALIVSPGDTLVVEAASLPAAGPTPAAPGDALEDVERAHIRRVLEAAGGRVTGRGNAAERLGINPSTLRSRMKKLGIK